jgi:alkylation response protein AidB-like acyl-CoA dehydrogenase
VLTEQQAIERARDLVPLLEKRAADAEALRQLPAETLADLQGSTLLDLLTPSVIGGHALGLSAVGQVTRELAHGCASTAWTASFYMLHSWILCHFSEQAREELFADSAHSLTPAALAPTGRISPTEGGYILSGRWSYGTGIMHADWVMVTAVGEVDGDLDVRFCVLPIEQVQVVDVWHMAGMRATGSNDVVVEDVVVPGYRTIAVADITNGRIELPWPDVMKLPLQPVLALTAASVGLGAAERALELFQQRMQDRILAYSLGDRQADQPAAQIRLADAAATLHSARAAWEHTVARVEAHEGGEMPLDLRAESRLVAAHTLRQCRTAINTICEASGAAAYAESSPLQRIQRDIETMKGHVIFDWDRTAEMVGRIRLGQPLRPADLI